jgi:hypothetical protein
VPTILIDTTEAIGNHGDKSWWARFALPALRTCLGAAVLRHELMTLL